jgi:GMP synthase (glutamine-hydrolysing)
MLAEVGTTTEEAAMQAVVAQHVPYEGPGLIAPAPAVAGAEVRVVRVDRHEPLPEASRLDVLVALGGPVGALDDRDHPHLTATALPQARR